MNHLRLFFYGFLTFVSAVSTTSAQTTVLEIEARDDMPGSVEIEIEGADGQGGQTILTSLLWDMNDNNWRSRSIDIPDTTRVLRFTFKNDFCGPNCPADQDDDRNMYIDSFTVFGVQREAEHYDQTGGTDPNPAFQGCAPSVVDGRLVLVCGNDEDWASYTLSFAQCNSGSCVELAEHYTANENNHVNVIEILVPFPKRFYDFLRLAC